METRVPSTVDGKDLSSSHWVSGNRTPRAFIHLIFPLVRLDRLNEGRCGSRSAFLRACSLLTTFLPRGEADCPGKLTSVSTEIRAVPDPGRGWGTALTKTGPDEWSAPSPTPRPSPSLGRRRPVRTSGCQPEGTGLLWQLGHLHQS